MNLLNPLLSRKILSRAMSCCTTVPCFGATTPQGAFKCQNEQACKNPGKFDALVLVATPKSFEAPDSRSFGCYKPALSKVLGNLKNLDKECGKPSTISVISESDVPGGRLIVAPTGPIDRDYDDQRRWYDAAFSGMKRALASGSRNPLLLVDGESKDQLCATMGAYKATYVSIQAREFAKEKPLPADCLSVCCADSSTEKLARPIELGLSLARDLGGADPERMTPARFADYISECFKGTCIKVAVEKGQDHFEKEYPCLAAVNRGVAHTEHSEQKHGARMVQLDYEGEGPITQTLFLVGKGVCYDTGGHDLKVQGIMAGMHRDKLGASGVAGFFKVLEQIKPAGLKVVGFLGVVRNEIGPDAYVSDEIVTSRAGVRVRVINTDAEGRMAMVDLLAMAKERALKEPADRQVNLMTVATLTGHCVRTYGDNYTAVMDNGPAAKIDQAGRMKRAGADFAEPCEISTIRREDYDDYRGKMDTEDCLQCPNKPAPAVSRGHQGPAAFMIIASGLENHGIDSKSPLKYTHLDIAGSGKMWPELPSGAPIRALTAEFVCPRIGVKF